MYMSRIVIHDIVMPIVQKILQQTYSFPGHTHFTAIRDVHLEEFLEEELRRHFGVIGANDCQHLREQLSEAKRNDPYSFDLLIRRFLNRYVQLQTKLRLAKKLPKSKLRKQDTIKKKPQKKKTQSR
jgi:hypothetical protein